MFRALALIVAASAAHSGGELDPLLSRVARALSRGELRLGPADRRDPAGEDRAARRSAARSVPPLIRPTRILIRRSFSAARSSNGTRESARRGSGVRSFRRTSTTSVRGRTNRSRISRSSGAARSGSPNGFLLDRQSETSPGCRAFPGGRRTNVPIRRRTVPRTTPEVARGRPWRDTGSEQEQTPDGYFPW